MYTRHARHARSSRVSSQYGRQMVETVRFREIVSDYVICKSTVERDAHRLSRSKLPMEISFGV